MKRFFCTGRAPSTRRLWAWAKAWACACACAGIGLLGAAAPAAAQTADAADAADLAARLALGQRIYRTGLGSGGRPLQAIGAGQTRLSGAAAACAGCHRRSGFGSSEGQFSARPITAAALFEEQSQPVRSPRIKAQLGSRQRPPYTEALLARALASGLDAGDQPLEPLMPRYALNQPELQALAAYLATLSLPGAPGVDAQDIHFATVIQPGVTPARRRAMLEVMQAFFRDKGANMRQDASRREAGTMRMYRSYRKWVLHVWDLSGPSSGWNAQLEAHYRAQPVFALLGGLGDASWTAVHAFCERLEIPALLAQTELPELALGNQYNLYFSRGLTLDGEALAHYLGQTSPAGPVLQVLGHDAAAQTAAAALRRGLGAGAGRLQDWQLQGPLDAQFWQQVAAAQPTALVLWLTAQELASAAPVPADLVLYLSHRMLGARLPEPAFGAGAELRLLYPSDLAPRHESRLLRSKIWLHNKGLALTDESLQVNTLFALSVASDALGHMMDSFSRDFFVERVEHVLGQTPMPSFYQSVSLGPGQRFAAKGVSVVQLQGGAILQPLSPWIVP